MSAARPSVAIGTAHSVSDAGGVEDMVFEAEDGSLAVIEVGADEVLDDAVGAGSDAEVDEELEVGVLARGDDVAGVAAFFAAVLGNRDHAVLDLPAGGGEGGAVVSAPAVGGLAIEEEMPAFSGLSCGESVGCGLRDGGNGGG